MSLINASLFGTKALTQSVLEDMGATDGDGDEHNQISVPTTDALNKPTADATPPPNFKHLCIAGAMAGAASGLLASPIELLKIRQQLDQRGKDAVKLWPLTRDIVKNSGWLSLFRGLNATMMRELPSYPAYFATYEYSRMYVEECFARA